MNYSSDGESMNAPCELDQTFSNFFAVVGAAMRETFEVSQLNTESLKDVKLTGLATEQRWHESDLQFHQKVLNCQEQVSSRIDFS